MSVLVAPTRQEAIEAGLGLYHGKPCPHCKGTVRRTWNHVCAPCNAAYVKSYKADMRARNKAGERTYEGRACKTCLGTTRLMRNGNCKTCWDASSASRIADMLARTAA